MIPFIKEKRQVVDYPQDIFDKLIKERIIFIYDTIDDTVASEVISNLILLDQESQEKITLIINSDGGEIAAIFAIYDVMKLIKTPIETICTGSALDESLLLVIAGTKGLRSCTESAFFCLSQLYHDSYTLNDLTNVRISLDQTKENNKRFLTAIAECTSKEVIKSISNSDKKVFMNASQAKKLGLIDNIIKGKTSATPKTRNKKS